MQHRKNFILMLLESNQANWALIQLWNVILDVYQSRDKNFIKRIIPSNRASLAPYEQPLIGHYMY
jgi:hypothetical protein